jgi:hypothetical protein
LTLCDHDFGGSSFDKGLIVELSLESSELRLVLGDLFV